MLNHQFSTALYSLEISYYLNIMNLKIRHIMLNDVPKYNHS